MIQEESARLLEMIVCVILSKKGSFKHVSDFRRLRINGHFLIPVHALMWTAFTEPAGGIMNSASLVASTPYLDCGEGGVS